MGPFANVGGTLDQDGPVNNLARICTHDGEEDSGVDFVIWDDGASCHTGAYGKKKNQIGIPTMA